jgi:putative inorganic carbon (HCO3(-)) transporter
MEMYFRSAVKRPQTRQQWSLWIEGAALLAVAPFLLFPTVIVEGTFLALCLLVLIWLLPLLFEWWPMPPATPLDVILLLWGLVLMVGIIVTADPDLTLPKATGLILGLAVWRSLQRVVQTRTQWYGAMAVLALLGVGFVLLGALDANWLFKIPALSTVLHLLPNDLISVPESPTAGVHANQIAGTLVFFIPLLYSVLIGLYAKNVSGWRFWGWLCLTGLASVFLLLTQSRTGWIAGAGSLLALFILWGVALPRSHRLRPIIWGALVLMLVVGAVAVAAVGPERLQELWQDPSQETAVGSLGSVSFRQEVWRWAIMATKDFPFTGTGLGTFRRVVRRLYPLDAQPTYDIAHAHNIFLQTALDVGLPGLVVYLALVITNIALGWQVAKRDEALRPLLLGLLGGLVATHIFGLTDALALGSKTGLIFWMMLALITAAHRLTTVPAPKPDVPVT